MRLIFVALLLASCSHGVTPQGDDLEFDHFLYAGPSLDSLRRELTGKSGVEAAPGVQHPDLGTHNAIIELPEGAYLELIAPDPNGKVPAKVLGIGNLQSSKLVAWAAHVRDLDRLHQRFLASGIQVTPLLGGSGKKADGSVGRWRYFFVTDARFDEVPRIIPFFIENQQARGREASCRLVSLEASHPEPAKFALFEKVIPMGISVSEGAHAQLSLTLDCPKGRVTLQ